MVTPGVSRKLNEIRHYYIENISVETALNLKAGIFDAIEVLSTFHKPIAWHLNQVRPDGATNLIKFEKMVCF